MVNLLLLFAFCLMVDEDFEEEESLLLISSVFMLMDKRENRRNQLLFRMNFALFSDYQFSLMFRFDREGFERLHSVLCLPAEFILQNRCKVESKMALKILLRRLAYPCRLADLCLIFGYSSSILSLTINYMLHYIDSKCRDQLKYNKSLFSGKILSHFAERNRRKGCPLPNCVGFIDGTLITISRPTDDQRLMYSGHKRKHGIKFQSIVNPQGIFIFIIGIIVHLAGPFEGRIHDANIFRNSGIMFDMHDNLNHDNRRFCIFGDPAYGLGPYIQIGFGNTFSSVEADYNYLASKCRISVEWGFAKIASLFAFVKFEKNLKIGLQPVGLYYRVAAVLTNAHTCLYSSQTAHYFDCSPPDIYEYFSSD